MPAPVLPRLLDHHGAAAAGERVRKAISARPISFPGGSLQVTVSIGVASSLEEAPTSEVMLRAADDALYRAKRAGRDRVA